MLDRYETVASAWYQYVNKGEVSDKLSSIVAKSWKRNAGNHNPFGRAEIVKLEEHRLREQLEKNSLLLEVAVPTMQDIYEHIKGSGSLVILTDASGYILKVIGDNRFYDRAKQVNLSEGVNWAERFKGTNAIGTALVEKVPLTIFAHEHFYQENHFLTCAAAPIFDLNGNLMGVLDISGDYRTAHPHSLGLVVAGSKAIQSRLLVRQIQQRQHGRKYRLGYEARYTFERIISRSEIMKNLVNQARKVARSNSPALLLGESGTGKELVAQAIHNASSRADGPFIAVNCGAVPRDLIEAELFGYEEGAFTGARKGGAAGKFELAQGGTLFLDEIGDMPLEVQAVLLRVLQEKQFTRVGGHRMIPLDVRIIAATNKDLFQLVQEGKFRLDLYYRINVLSLKLPPLRERLEDIEPLVHHFLAQFKAGAQRQDVKLSPAVMEIFKKYTWPGNIRELINVIERAVTMVDEDIIMPYHLPEEILKQCRADGAGNGDLKTINISGGRNLRDIERESIEKALAACAGNVSQAAKKLGIGRTTLYRKMKKYGLKA
ncbi:MAG: sigma-54-dependent Fis family transcriptional regulator [Thermoanaerobacteraceae bacterium]|nr:sigma-54-dependent Fis family transcriptional regulator [Thermoanaerobacteraceae bacterium]